MKVIETAHAWLIRCRACGEHRIPRHKGWLYNSNPHSPTFTPSIDETVNQPDMKDYRPGVASSRCHFTVTEGKITYCDGCSHSLLGQTLELEDFPADTVAFYRDLAKDSPSDAHA